MRLDASVRSSEPEDPSPGGSGSQGAGGGGAEGAGAAEGGSVASREVDGKTWHAPGVLGCPHYARACQLVAPCCGRIYTCRQCHDDAEDHAMDRYAVERMRCMRCGGEGPVGQDCSHCGGRSARYYCAICHLMDDTPGRDIYHCPFCNVCRRGKGLGVDFFHCMQVRPVGA